MNQQNSQKLRWIFFNIIIAFSFYWFSNLILWFPWTINEYFGMTLMLTLGVFVWFYAVYVCLIRYQGNNKIKAAIINALIFLVLAVVMDIVFFGLIRNAFNDLYHPTTFYAYAFLIVLPFTEIFLFKKLLNKNKRKTSKKDLIYFGIFGALSLLLLTMIIKLNISIV